MDRIIEAVKDFKLVFNTAGEKISTRCIKLLTFLNDVH